ncbi:uncharacterized protein LOC113215182 isoform X2 [Frankliniella occidentalis]|uniref:Uncharacterized protein LOC113215182 isoform X2 n=1 Tax=Frankliniella occidentalis TaxID=133901 RepID=A0A9C6WS41_FRAOC|nr:uncharacterized protein LOC113215182 isoform X2 [Frankliniella occidentalis]
MECDICLEDYNQVERVPKMVPCGHTVCLRCLEQSSRKECPTCRRVFDVPPHALPNNFHLLGLMERPERPPRSWCSDCRASAAPRCWDADHDVLPERRALRRYLQGALQRAPGQLEDLPDNCQGEQVVQALTLLAADSWCLTLQSGAQELTGNVRNTEDPLTQLMWLLVARKAALTESRVEARGPPPAAPGPAPGPAPPEARPVREMNATAVSTTDPPTRQNCRADLLAQVPGVTRLLGVWCDGHPAWSLQLLQNAAPTVERLSLCRALEAHLRAVHAMPRLRRLSVWGDDALLVDAQPPVVPAFPPGHAGLQWLMVNNLPRATTQSLLWAHGGTLEELWLYVGTAGSNAWPESCGDLHSLLQQSGLRALRRIVLRRKVQWGASHEPAACSQQRAEVRRVLPGAEVLCSMCDGVEEEQV